MWVVTPNCKNCTSSKNKQKRRCCVGCQNKGGADMDIQNQLIQIETAIHVMKENMDIISDKTKQDIWDACMDMCSIINNVK